MANPDDVARVGPGANLRNANLRNANLRNANLRNADLSGADLSNADLSGARLSGAKLRGANLSAANLSGARLIGADLGGARLSRADLSGAVLRGAHLPHATLHDTNLTGADLQAADLRRAELAGARLHSAHLRGAKLTGANMRGADLNDALLIGTILVEADLAGANLSHARLLKTLFVDVDLSTAIGLETCKHYGPSAVDHRTLLRSGRLPVAFLRGCGLPDTLIDYLPSLQAVPIQFFSCFISYSTLDQEFAERLHADLQAHNIRCWFAPHDMQPGRKVHEQIDEAIRDYDRLLLILSSASMSSAWVKTEIAKARRKEVSQRRRVLFPLSLVPFSEVRSWEHFNADLGEDTAREIREYYVPSFTHWKTDHDLYQREFKKVVSALKDNEPRPAAGTTAE